MLSTLLPDLDRLDIAALRALIVEQHAQHVDAHSLNLQTHAAYLQDISTQSQEIERQRLIIEKLKRMLFGAKSEKLSVQLAQLELQLEELESTQGAAEVRAEQAPKVPRTRPKTARKPLPEHLPREVINHTPKQDCCPDCGSGLRNFGEDISEVLEYIPDHFKVIRHVRPKFACTGCDRVVEAAAPPRTIERGLAGPALLAHVLVAKYADHCPLFRQSEIYARQGVDIGRSTLAGWVGAASELLSPLVDALRNHVLSGKKIHADDTPVPVLAPGNGKTRTGRLWTYVRDDRPAGDNRPPAVWFAYSADRKGEHPRQHLKSFQGALQADAYAGFHHLYDGGVIYEVACWAHARRKFHDVHILQASPTTTEALARIGALYGIEEEVRGKPSAWRCSVRQARARPLLEQLKQWMEQSLRSLSTKSETAGAIRYALSHWKALTRYLDDGLLEIDNSAAERALRAVALGRKNYLFCGADSGGHRAAAIYSLVGSAKLNGLDPELYLRQVLTSIPEHPISRIEELLPWKIVLADTPPSVSSSAEVST
jgi:transposase